MWAKLDKSAEQIYLQKAIKFTGNHVLYGNAMKEVVYKWKNTMLNHLSNININRRAFLGHCAVMYKLQIPEYIVRAAWKHLTNKQRTLADNEAQKNINEWEIWYNKKLKTTSIYGKKDVIVMEYQIKLPLK